MKLFRLKEGRRFPARAGVFFSHILSTAKLTAALALGSALALAQPASAAVTVTTENQQGAAGVWPFTPSWTVNTNNSLIAGLTPTTANGNFSLEVAGRTPNSLTTNVNLTIDILQPSTSTSTNYVTAGNGSGAGSLLVYTLPSTANGYNITNITVYGGWANNGRDAQGYTVLYSTVDKPASFKYLATVSYNPTVPGNTASANREILNDSTGAAIATNVAALQFDFTVPRVENGFVGYAAITVGGTPAATLASSGISITTSNETGANPYTPTWTPESPNLIAGLTPTTFTGNFNQEGSGGVGVLTDDLIGTSGDVTTFATAGTGAGTTLIYTLPNITFGTDLTNVVVYSGWADNGRDGQYFTLSYSTIAAPSTFIPITTVYYNPQGVVGASANRVAVAMKNGSALASGVSNLKFDFASPPNANQFDNAYSGYSEIIVQGTDTATPPPPPSPVLVQDILPTRVETFVGDQVVFTADYSNAPPASLQWQFITAAGTATNDVPGATSATLTLSNVQASNSGSYRLKAVNATNSLAAPSYSSAGLLTVTAPGTVGNVIAQNTAQAAPFPFYPPWSINQASDLILGFPSDGSGNPGTATQGPGNFSNEAGLAFDTGILTDGILGGDKSVMVSGGWVNVGAGQSMTYFLPTAAQGYTITNITIYGGWPDDGRNEQKYQVLFSTVAAPTTFTSIGTFDYNPSFTSGEPNATRVSLVPSFGALAQNVYALQINFNLQSKNNWNGYSEITVGGLPSTGVIPTLTEDINPLTAEDVVGSSLILTGAFNGATSYQWQKNGTNLPGATTTTLTLNNLQLSDTATNGGYRLLGINSAGTNATRGANVIVDPSPAATNNVITAFAYQSSDAGAPNTFTPTWDISALSSSLIFNQSFPEGGTGTGNFSDPDAGFPNNAGGLPVLTDGNYGSFAFDGTHPAFATGGPSAGQYVIYNLGPDPKGYSVNKIQIAGGWNDNGRNAQFYTVSYSTVDNPTTFIPIKAVANSPTFPSESVIRTTITPASGALTTNAFSIKVDFTNPPNVPNGYSGYSEVSVFGSPSPNADTGPVVTTENQNIDIPSWTIETPNLISGVLPSASTGDFTGGAEGLAGLAALTDGTYGDVNTNRAAAGTNPIQAGTSLTYTSANGWTLTNIVVYSGWTSYDRDGQFYNISYSTLAAPTTFIPLTSVDFNPVANFGPSANRVSISAPTGGILASNVSALKFDFTRQGAQDNGYSGYNEIVLRGASQPAQLHITSVALAGGNVTITGAGGAANSGYTLLTATDVAAPASNWTVSSTGTFDASGNFTKVIPVESTKSAAFFKVRAP